MFTISSNGTTQKPLACKILALQSISFPVYNRLKYVLFIIIFIFNTWQTCFREFKNWDIQNWVQITSLCSQGPATCHVTRQHCCAVLEMKLSWMICLRHFRVKESRFDWLIIFIINIVINSSTEYKHMTKKSHITTVGKDYPKHTLAKKSLF